MFQKSGIFVLSLLLSLWAVALAAAEQTDAAVFKAGNKMPVSEFLSDDGSIDLEAIRQSGFEGNLDLDGFNVRLDEQARAPLVSPESMNSDPDDQYWQPLGSGMTNCVMSLAIYNNELIAGGYFLTVGGVAVNRIARWDGFAWQPLGSGMDGGDNNRVSANLVTIF